MLEVVGRSGLVLDFLRVVPYDGVAVVAIGDFGDELLEEEVDEVLDLRLSAGCVVEDIVL